ncbi:MAG: S-layer homology domain-containing protein [Oscillospiraceae bacterium]|nr:S-layer homology domain-containing protein [Oscillospiraceae bacterium]
MKKRIVSAFLALLLLIPAAGAAGTPGLSNFQKSNAYTPGQFSDVASNAWYASSVQAAYEYGLMQGTNGKFNPGGNLTIGEAVAIASRVHATYQGNGYQFPASNPWYQSYVDYAATNGVAAPQYPDYNAAISRAAFVMIMANTMPDAALSAINSVEDGSIPDVAPNINFYSAVYKFYRAGVLSGTGDTREFQPSNKITRAEVSVILSSLINPALRKSFTLKVQPVTLYASGGRTITVNPSEVNSYLSVGWSKTEKVYAPKNTALRIRRHPVPETNSAGGVSFYIEWNTHRDKTIKYVHFYVTPYNNVWDVQKCEIRRYSNADCYVAGPISKTTLSTAWEDMDYGDYCILTEWPGISIGMDEQGRFSSIIDRNGTYTNGYGTQKVTAGYLDDVMIRTYWENMWYNDQIKKLLINKVVIEYMDGTKETLTGNALNACFY